MPEAPSWIDKVNYVVNFWVDPCHAPLLVYLELAAEPAGNLVLAWFSFGLDDVIRGYLRPNAAFAGGGFKRRGKKRKPKIRWIRNAGRIVGYIKLFPGLGDDTGNWIGKRLPGARLVKSRAITAGEKALWIVDGVAQRALLYVFLADILTDFAYEWALALNESEFCKRDHAGSLYATGPGTSAGGLLICNAGSAPDVLWAEGGPSWAVSAGGAPAGNWHFISAMVVKNNGSGIVQHQQRVLVEDNNGTRFEFTDLEGLGPGEQGTSIFSISTVGPSSWVVNHCAFGGVVSAVSHDVSIWGDRT